METYRTPAGVCSSVLCRCESTGFWRPTRSRTTGSARLLSQQKFSAFYRPRPTGDIPATPFPGVSVCQLHLLRKSPVALHVFTLSQQTNTEKEEVKDRGKSPPHACPRRRRDRPGARSLAGCGGASLLPAPERGKPFPPGPGRTAAAPSVSPAARPRLSGPGAGGEPSLPARRREPARLPPRPLTWALRDSAMSWAPLTASPSAALPEAIPIPVPVPVIPAQAQAGAAHRGSRRNRTPGRRSGAVE